MALWRIKYTYEDGFVEMREGIDAPDAMSAIDTAQPSRVGSADVTDINVDRDFDSMADRASD